MISISRSGVWPEGVFAGASSGVLLALSFPPYPTRFLLLIALVPIFWYYLLVFPRVSAMSADIPGYSSGRLWLKSGTAVGFSFGITFFLMLLFWIANLIPASSVHHPFVLIPGLVLLVVYLSCYPVIFTVSLSYLTGRFGSAALVFSPALWALTELARSRGELGFSWGIVSASLVPYPVAIQGLSIYGPFGLSMVFVTVNLLVAIMIFDSRKKARLSSAGALVAIIAFHILWGAHEIAMIESISKGQGQADVAVVQPNLDLEIKWNPAYRDTIFSQIERLTDEAASHGAKLVIFPETAAPISIKATPNYLFRLEDRAAMDSVDLLMGFIDHERHGGEWRSYNAAGLIDRKGNLTDIYHKVNLLPFGEKMPFSEYLPFLSSINFGQSNFDAGKRQTIFKSSEGSFGVLICFESTFSDYTRRFISNGARFLVNITNDGWFGSGRGPNQHAELAILRAVENRVTLLRAANTGVSMVVDPAGRVTQRIGLNREGIIYTSIVPYRGPTIFTRFGLWIFFVMVLANIAGGIVALSVRSFSVRSFGGG